MISWKKNILPVWVFLVICSTGTGCKRSIDAGDTEPQRSLEAYIRFLVPENEYKIQLVFTEGDSAANLRPVEMSRGITWAGQALRAKNRNTPDFRYEMLAPGPYSPRHVFEFEESNGAKRKLVLEMAPIDGFRIGPTVSKESGATLRIEGAALSEGETLLLLFTDDQGTSHQLMFKGPVQSNAFELTPEMLRPLKSGRHELYLIKQQRRESVQNKRTIYSLIEWYSNILILDIS